MLNNSAGFEPRWEEILGRFEAIEASRKGIQDDQAVNGAETFCIPGDQRETTLDGCRRNQGVWQSSAVRLAQRDRPLYHGLVEWDALKCP